MVWNAANAPLRDPEPQCCYPGCPACDEAKMVEDARSLYGIAPFESGDTRRYESGVIRGDNTGKTDYTLALDGPLFERWAAHLTKHAQEKGERNWMNASSAEDYDRFRQSAFRHMVQIMAGDESEDHFAAVVFNLNGMLYTEGQRALAPSS
jgi:hypothetical protein